MNTPREILLARHRGVEPKLDALRRAVMAGEFNNEETKEQSLGLVAWFIRCLTTPWRELIFPIRRIWTALAVVWMVLFFIHLSQRDTVSSVTGNRVYSPAVVMSWQIQQRWMNELLADRMAPSEAERPKSAGPQPRTQLSEIKET